MAVGDVTMPLMHVVQGVKIGSTEAYVRYPNRRDLVIFELAEGSNVAGVFTQNAFCAAPVHVARAHLQQSEGSSRYWVINTGNANAGTGETGMNAARATCAAVADITGCDLTEVLPFSTGVIGEPLPVESLTDALPLAHRDLGLISGSGQRAPFLPPIPVPRWRPG